MEGVVQYHRIRLAELTGHIVRLTPRTLQPLHVPLNTTTGERNRFSPFEPRAGLLDDCLSLDSRAAYHTAVAPVGVPLTESGPCILISFFFSLYLHFNQTFQVAALLESRAYLQDRKVWYFDIAFALPPSHKQA